MLSFDVVVVGAGPAGSNAALEAAESGARVLLLDRRKQIGVPVQCAEYAPRNISLYAPIQPGDVIQKTSHMLTFIEGELQSDLRAPGYILNRAVFDRHLAERAMTAGVALWTQTEAVERTGAGLKVCRHGRMEEIECSYIIGADGPKSTVGKWIQSSNSKFMVALQWTLPLKKKGDATEIYFSPEYRGGYAWLFPKGALANVGIGVLQEDGPRLAELLGSFVERKRREGVLVGLPVRKTGGLAPAGGPLPVTEKSGILLAGDAAGHTHPVSGGGILNALICGKMAGETVRMAWEKRDPNLLSRYPMEWQALLGRHLRNAVGQREKMDREWTPDPHGFKQLIRQCWLAFT